MTSVMTSVESLFSPIGLPPGFPGFPNYPQLPSPSTRTPTADSFATRNVGHRLSTDWHWKPSPWTPSPSKLNPSDSEPDNPTNSPLSLVTPPPEVVSPPSSSTLQPTDPMTVAAPTPEIGQYEYADFDEVLQWIQHFTTVYGPRLAAAFDRYCRLRSYYLEQNRLEPALMMENLIKNHVGVRRLREERPEYFMEPNVGRTMKFYKGRFLGWRDELIFDPKLRAVCCYEI